MSEGKSDLDPLITKVESTPFEKITPGIKAQLVCELTKKGLTNGQIGTIEATNFANSLIYESIVPVTIGTPENKIFPIDSIITARPLIIQNLRDASLKEGVDFDKNCKERSQKASKAIEQIEKDYEKSYSQSIDKFGPLAKYLTGEQLDDEASQFRNNLNIARNIATGGEITTDEEFLRNFVQVDIPNVFFGQELRNWIESQK